MCPPIYDYQCLHEDCGHVEEHSSSVADRDKPQQCSNCGGQSKRIISPVTVILDKSFPGEKNKRDRLR